MRATCSAYIIFLSLNTQTIRRKWYKLRRSPMFSFLYATPYVLVLSSIHFLRRIFFQHAVKASPSELAQQFPSVDLHKNAQKSQKTRGDPLYSQRTQCVNTQTVLKCVTYFSTRSTARHCQRYWHLWHRATSVAVWGTVRLTDSTFLAHLNCLDKEKRQFTPSTYCLTNVCRFYLRTP
jgi:hypothetical protein